MMTVFFFFLIYNQNKQPVQQSVLREFSQPQHSVIIKATGQDQPNEETHDVRSRRVPNAELPCPLPWNQDVSPSQHIGEFTKLHWSEFLSGCQYIGKINWITDHMIDLSLQPLAPLQTDGADTAPSRVI